ncbi:(E)-4-hydroxy-3-methylbut-2-enyl-diphosphate synthase [bacterium]|nr:(E)-4-hydroxy-3-methylbut-2-enyl-diphosphate synthase [bacterium]
METINYPFGYQRIKTREISIGPLRIGGDNPICLQSMLTSSTQDAVKCLEEIKSLQAVNCSLIRLTIPSRKDLDNVVEIRRLMKEEGIAIPLVADIHFSPALAVDACDLFEKIRINPGNYSDKPKQTKSGSGIISFEEGYDRMKDTIKPLVVKLKQTRRALRVGVNQGSLSSRVMERFGDSPQGMVYSALEMVDLFEEHGFDQIVVSLKSSNPVVVQKAYRLLIEKQKGKKAVPLHLGVTEAGNGIMGRIKSLVGIGVLLLDGIGDTIRVSLTEPSANEIIFAREFLSQLFPPGEEPLKCKDRGFWQRDLFQTRVLNSSSSINGEIVGEGTPIKLGSPDGIRLPSTEVPLETDFFFRQTGNRLSFEPDTESGSVIKTLDDNLAEKKGDHQGPLAFEGDNPLFEVRRFYHAIGGQASFPVGYKLPATLDYVISTHLSGLLSEGLLDFLLIPEKISSEDLYRLVCILQATRSRILTTDYIICPSCGRTLFDIQSAAEKIKERTSHLIGLKIGIMGCIVNGPGEMADADFGYVGSGAGNVDLYFGQEQVKRGIAEEDAVDCLIALIKEKGFWKETG